MNNSQLEKAKQIKNEIHHLSNKLQDLNNSYRWSVIEKFLNNKEMVDLVKKCEARIKKQIASLEKEFENL